MGEKATPKRKENQKIAQITTNERQIGKELTKYQKEEILRRKRKGNVELKNLGQKRTTT